MLDFKGKAKTLHFATIGPLNPIALIKTWFFSIFYIILIIPNLYLHNSQFYKDIDHKLGETTSKCAHYMLLSTTKTTSITMALNHPI